MNGLEYSSAHDVRREAHLLVVPHVAVLPDRCIKCGDPCNGFRVKNRFYRKPPVYVRLFPFDVLFLLVSLLRSRITLAIGLCPRHRRRRNLVLLIASPVALAAFILLSVLANDYLKTLNASNATLAIPLALIIGGGAAVASVTSFRIVSLKKSDTQHAWYSGASLAFLRDIPEIK